MVKTKGLFFKFPSKRRYITGYLWFDASDYQQCTICNKLNHPFCVLYDQIKCRTVCHLCIDSYYYNLENYNPELIGKYT